MFSVVTAALVAVVGVCVAMAARSDKWWWDNLGGPDSSNFMNLDQINKSNVSQLEVAWFYPHASSGFNPIVVDDVMYTMGRGNALVALDASTGKEIWIHEDMGGMVGRGINYWQSEDGTDKRLITSIDSYLQEIDAKTGKSILDVRHRRHGQPARRPAARGRNGASGAVRQPGQGLEERDHPGIGSRRGVRPAAGGHSRL